MPATETNAVEQHGHEDGGPRAGDDERCDRVDRHDLHGRDLVADLAGCRCRRSWPSRRRRRSAGRRRSERPHGRWRAPWRRRSGDSAPSCRATLPTWRAIVAPKAIETRTAGKHRDAGDEPGLPDELPPRVGRLPHDAERLERDGEHVARLGDERTGCRGHPSARFRCCQVWLLL